MPEETDDELLLALVLLLALALPWALMARGSAHGHSLLWHPQVVDAAGEEHIRRDLLPLQTHELPAEYRGVSLQGQKGENEMGGLPDLEDEYIDMPDLEDPDEDEVVYVAAGGDNLLYHAVEGANADRLMASVMEAQQATAWYGRMLDGSSRYFDGLPEIEDEVLFGEAEPTRIGDLYGAAEPTSIDGEQGIIYLEVNRRGSLHTHLAAERFLQAREVSSAEAVFRAFGPQREAPAP